jgi:phage terminase large subunit-like protein
MELEDLIRKRKLSINAGNRLLDWCFANIALSIYDDGRRMPDKSRQSQGERIDPICALIFAIEAVRRFDLDKKEKSNNNDIYNLRPQDIPDIRKLFNI